MNLEQALIWLFLLANLCYVNWPWFVWFHSLWRGVELPSDLILSPLWWITMELFTGFLTMEVVVVPIIKLICYEVNIVCSWVLEFGIPCLWTRVVDYFSVHHEDNLRNDFRRFRAVATRDYKSSHSHPVAAAIRSTNDLGITNMIIQAGHVPYSVSPSDADDRMPVSGYRYFYGIKSLTQSARFDDVPDNAVIKLVDVDYYADMPSILAWGKPVVLHTFVPTRVAGDVPDGLFTIDEHDQIHYHVQGGAYYVHSTWDYERDIIAVLTWYGAIIYSVEQILTPEDVNRRTVGLFPRRTIYGPIGWLFAGHQLRRRQFYRNGWTTSRFMSSAGGTMTEYISVSKPMLNYSVTVPLSLGHSLATKIASSKDNKTPFATVQTVVEAMRKVPKFEHWAKNTEPIENAAMLTEAASQAPWLFGPPYYGIISLPDSHHYTVVNHQHVWDEELPSLRAVSSPWIDSSVTPTRCIANDKACLQHRIMAVKNNKEPPAIYNRYVKEFVEFLIPDSEAGTLVPSEFQEVYDKQKRPSQRAIIDRCIHWLYLKTVTIVSSFQKREAYGKITAPRNISTIPGALKVEYSTYMYAFAPILKRQHWYAFSLTPREIGEVLVSKLVNATNACLTDFSKFDGTHSGFLCRLEETVLRRAFAPCYHSKVVELYRAQYNATGYTHYGLRYDTGHSRLSGSPETSAFNSLDNAFVAYCALRKSKFTRSSDCERAWAALGLYGGDDGLTPNVSDVVYNQTAADFGLKLTSEHCERGQKVTFLSRVWPQCWTGDSGSYTAVARQVGKLHLTTAGYDVPDTQVLHRKALGYLLTDRNTPFIGCWSRAVIRLCGWDGKTRIPGDEKWFEQYDATEQFHQPEDDWSMADSVAADLGVTWTELHDAEARLEKASLFVELFPTEPWFKKTIKVELEVKNGLDVRTPEAAKDTSKDQRERRGGGQPKKVKKRLDTPPGDPTVSSERSVALSGPV